MRSASHFAVASTQQTEVTFKNLNGGNCSVAAAAVGGCILFILALHTFVPFIMFDLYIITCTQNIFCGEVYLFCQQRKIATYRCFVPAVVAYGAYVIS